MARISKPLEPFDYAVLAELKRLQKSCGLSGRAIGDKAGLGNNRAAIILRGGEPPATLGELDRLAQAVGSSASAIARAAEAAMIADQVGDDPGQAVTALRRARSRTGDR